MDAVKKEVDVSKEWFPSTHLMYDKEEKTRKYPQLNPCHKSRNSSLPVFTSCRSD
jgi:hypothetical protein